MSHRSNRTVAVTTLGCKVNQAEADEWARGFVGLGYQVVRFDQPADAYVLNTCTITHVADRKSRQLLRQARRQNPAALVVAAGCYAAVASADVAGLAEVDLVVSGADKPRLVEMVHAGLEGESEQPLEAAGRGSAAGARTRAFVKIGDGCDKFCAFCIVPYARGRERSVPFGEVLARAREAADAGYREIVLTAVLMGTYGLDLDPPTNLRALVEAVLLVTPIQRLRVSSIEPEDFDLRLLELWQRYPSRLCRHFHLSLDSGCDATLRRMRRRYTADQYWDLVQAIRSAVPGLAITTDIIVGFPGETEAEFAENYAFVERVGFAQAHVFKYSPRHRTAAAKMPDQIPYEVKRARSDAMLALADRAGREFRSRLLGQTLDVLYEAPLGSDVSQPAPGTLWEGLTDNYVRVVAQSDVSLANCLVPTRLVAEGAEGLKGRVEQVRTAQGLTG